jgi:AraC-like DNA-binding protein
MLFQPILSHENSLIVILDNISDFTLHKHYENEILYCTKGSYKVIINNEPYILNEGSLAFIQSFIPHETKETEKDSITLLIEAGPLFLGDYFDSVSTLSFDSPVFKLGENDFGNKIKILLEDIIEEKQKLLPNELVIRGNATKFFGLFLNEFSAIEPPKEKKDTIKIKNIEKVLDLIYHSYPEKITVELAAEIAGYGKSNFCKIFKNTMGISFHQYLNRYRIERSKFFLKHTDMSVSEIAETIGFNDSKTYCRVFKEITGATPKEYSKS